MELFDAIRTRRSIRTYEQKPVPKDILKKIVEAGTWAPTACNRQAFRFIAVDDQRTKDAVVANGAASFIKNAPVVLFILYDNRTDNLEYADHIQSASAAIENILLAAHALGVGACWVCHMPKKDALRKILGIPGHFDPIACVPMGYHRHTPKALPRAPVNEVLCSNTFSFKAEPAKFGVGTKRRLRKAYFSMPPAMRRAARPLASKFEKKFEGT